MFIVHLSLFIDPFIRPPKGKQFAVNRQDGNLTDTHSKHLVYGIFFRISDVFGVKLLLQNTAARTAI